MTCTAEEEARQAVDREGTWADGAHMIILIKYGGEYGHFIRPLLIPRVYPWEEGTEDQVSYFLHRVVMVNKKHKDHGSN